MLCRLFNSLVLVAMLTGCDLPDPAGPDRVPVGERTSAIPQGREPVVLEMADYELGVATAVNDHGDAVGWLSLDGRVRAVLWADGELVLLQGLGEDGDSRATDLNDAGVIVGSAEDAQGRERAVRWVDGEPEDLGTLGGEEATALGINQRGQIVGVSETEGDLQGFLWDDGALTALPPGPNAEFAYAEDINEQGVVVGWSAGGAVLQDATIWVEGTPARLPTLAYEAAASAINDRGQIVGGSFPDYQTSVRGVRWVGGEVEDLPTPPEVESSSANDINNRGHIVGFALGATVWRGRRFRRIDAGGLGQGINARGDVVGRRLTSPFLWSKRAPDLDWIRPLGEPSPTARPTTPAAVAAPSGSTLCREVAVATPGVQALCGR